jgi:hypothetical protein
MQDGINLNLQNKCCLAEMSARTPENQYTELAIRCRIINKMNKLGLPDSVAVF